MIPVQSIIEINEWQGSLGFSYLSLSYSADGVKPARRTYLPIRNERGIIIDQYFVPAEVL